MFALNFFASALAQNSTGTANLKLLSGSASQPTGTSIRVDLQNCSAPRVPGTGNIGEKSRTFYPNTSGLVTITLYSNSILDCGAGVLTNPVSFYTFNLVSNGMVTSLGSYKVPSGSWTLDTLTPINTVPIVNSPNGDNSYLRLDLGNFSGLAQPVPNWSVAGTVNSNSGFKFNGAAPSNHVLCGNGTSYVDAASCGSATGVTSFNARTGAVTLNSADVVNALGYTPPTPGGIGAGGTWNINVTGNSATSSLSDHTPSQCPTGSYARGVTNTWAASGCTPVVTPTLNVQGAVAAGCSAGAGTYNTCGPITLNWPTPFADANYTATCFAFDANAGPGSSSNESGTIYLTLKNAVGIQVWVQNGRGSFAFSPSEIDCTGVHN